MSRLPSMRSNVLLLVALVVLSGCSGSTKGSNAQPLPGSTLATGGASSTLSARGSTSLAPSGGLSGRSLSPDAKASLLAGQPLVGKERSVFVYGALHSNRMIGLDASTLAMAGVPKIVWRSPVFGAVIAAAVHGETLWALSSNSPDLVRLSFRSTQVQSKNLPSQMNVSGRPSFGSLVYNSGKLLVSYETGDAVHVAWVDPTSLKVIKSITFTDRIAAFPQICVASSGRLALASSTHIDFLDFQSLRRVQAVSLDSPTGLACGSGRVFAANYRLPTGTILTAGGAKVGTFAWKGSGSDALFYDPSARTLFGTDDVGGIVFRCVGGECATSQAFGNKPTSLCLMGDHLLVDFEGAEGVAVLSPRSLKLVRHFAVGDLPRVAMALRV